ncbi:hypothetical protein [Hydrogenimonas sp.]
MRRGAWLLLVPLLLGATPALTDRVTVWLNKPGVQLRTVPVAWLQRLREKLGARELRTGIEMGVVRLEIRQPPRTVVHRIQTSVDLSTWFVDKGCLKSWDDFHACLNREEGSPDETLYRRLERDFVAKVQCQEACEEPSFPKWRLRWVAPAHMVLEADIGGDGGFRDLDAAKESLRAVNGLLKKVLYGARFPEDYGEGRTPFEVFALDSATVQNFDFKHAVRRLLWRLKEAGYLRGVTGRDIDAIEKLAKPGKAVYYIPGRCTGGSMEGWYAVSNGSRIRFDTHYCPRVRVLR